MKVFGVVWTGGVSVSPHSCLVLLAGQDRKKSMACSKSRLSAACYLRIEQVGTSARLCFFSSFQCVIALLTVLLVLSFALCFFPVIWVLLWVIQLWLEWKSRAPSVSFSAFFWFFPSVPASPLTSGLGLQQKVMFVQMGLFSPPSSFTCLLASYEDWFHLLLLPFQLKLYPTLSVQFWELRTSQNNNKTPVGKWQLPCH